MDFTLLYPGFKRKAVTFSYDDSIIEDRETISILKSHGLKGTFNLNLGQSGEEKIRSGVDCSHLVLEKEYSLYDGMEIATHTYKHPHLETLPFEEQKKQYRLDIEGLEKLTGRKIIGSAYPYGTYNLDTLNALKELVIVYARTTRSTYDFTLPYNFLLWHPTIHHNDPRMFEILDSFYSCNKELACLYIWGHSYEFAIQDYAPFSLLERIAASLEDNRKDIAFMTNGEIYTYVNAATMVYYRDGGFVNPSTQDIYLKAESEYILVRKGEKYVYPQH